MFLDCNTREVNESSNNPLISSTMLTPPNKDDQKQNQQIWFWIWIALVILYWIFPVDFIPDFVPVAGWIDDVLFSIFGVYKAIQNSK